MNNKSPIQNYIEDLSLILSMNNFVFHLNDYGHRLNPDFFTCLKKLKARDGSHLRLDDQAVQSFFDVLGLDVNLGMSAADIHTHFGSEFDFHEQPEHHSCLQAVKDLVALRKDNGWVELNKLLTVTHGVPLGSFFDEISIHYHPDDTGPVGEIRYRVRVDHAGISSDGYALRFADEWFAVSSTCEHALRLVEMIMTGSLQVLDKKTFDSQLAISSIQVMKGQLPILHVLMENPDSAHIKGSKKIPLVCDGRLSKVYGDASLVKAIAMFAPSLDMRRANGLVLEDSLGL